MQIHCYLFQSTLDKPCSAQSFRPCVFAVNKEPLTRKPEQLYFYNMWCNIFDTNQ